MNSTLYERLGSAGGIARLVDDVVAAMVRHELGEDTKKVAILYSLNSEIIRV